MDLFDQMIKEIEEVAQSHLHRMASGGCMTLEQYKYDAGVLYASEGCANIIKAARDKYYSNGDMAVIEEGEENG